ncbi:MAG: CHAT domain-containing protein [Deltaproteobacteria bacterium]|nr:CHAT domain-containing protein [Deltaproteobacteria bacterium]
MNRLSETRRSKSKYAAWITAVLALFLASGCAIPDPNFEVREGAVFYTRRALSRGKIKEALAFYESEARTAEENAAASFFPQQYWDAAARAYIEAARAARFNGDLQKSITHAKKALEAAEKAKSPELQIGAISNLILPLRSIRDFDQVSPLIEKGLKIVEEIPTNTNRRLSRESSLYEHLGKDLVRRREYEQAIVAFTRALYLQQDWLADLYRWFRKDHPYIEVARVGIILKMEALGDAYRRAGRLQDALQQYERAFNFIKEWGLRYPYENALHQGMGEIFWQKKDFHQALEQFNLALTLAEKQQRPNVIRSASLRIADILGRTGKAADAISYYQKAIQQIESVRSLITTEEYRGSYFAGGLSAYAGMTRALLDVGKQEEAFNYTERSRSRVFLDVLGSKVQLSGIKGGLLAEERTLKERIVSIRTRLGGRDGETNEDGQTARAILRRELREAERAYADFFTRVRKENKEQASLMTVEPLTVKEVQELLDPGATLIEYFVTEREIFAWVVEKDKVRFVRVELPRKKRAGLVKSLRETIFALGDKDKFRVASTVLYQHLIEGILPYVTGKELIIVPHDVLHYLPFHALVSPDGRYLIEKYPIYYLSSASLLQFTKEKRKAKGDLSAVLAQAGRVLAFGNPDLGDPDKELKFAELEAQEVQRLYPQSTVLLKREATEEKGKTLSPQHDILHFATHAKLNEDDPLSSAILLAKDGTEDGRLEVREIFGMDLKANLVVLSACETGLGKLSTGDEIVGLTRAFIYAGTPSVVASLWKVEDSSTAYLMASFYKNLRTMSKVEALRQAQLELIRGQASSDLLARRGVGGIGRLGEVPEAKPQSLAPVSVSTSHPYFWAPFILVGDGK